MKRRRQRMANFIIGGTEKAGTTSVFDWLAEHPQVGAALRKETDFFREHYTGDLALDARRYAGYFSEAPASATVLMEASPGYLGEAATVAPRMHDLVPSARLLFILREPVSRFHSSFEFHRGRLNLPASLTIEEYVERCLAFDRGDASASELGLDPWYLKVLRFGRYAELLDIYRRELPDATIKVAFFEDLRRDPRRFMVDLSGFLGIAAEGWERFRFHPSNVTYAGRIEGLHRLALRANSTWEPMLRRVPALKRALVRIYKLCNQERAGYEPLPIPVRERLVDYYRPSVLALEQQLAMPFPEPWWPLMRGGVRA